MHIYVDADACPVVGIVESLAEKYNIPVTLLCDTNHIIHSDYSEVITVGAGADAVDFNCRLTDREWGNKLAVGKVFSGGYKMRFM